MIFDPLGVGTFIRFIFFPWPFTVGNCHRLPQGLGPVSWYFLLCEPNGRCCVVSIPRLYCESCHPKHVNGLSRDPLELYHGRWLLNFL